MKLKYLPNALSLTRLALCIPLIFLSPFTLLYIVILAVASITDSLDGQLARRIKNGASELGATLDSVADVCLIAVIIFVMMPKMLLWGWLWIAFACVLILKVTVSTGIGFIRFKEIISLHTITLKILATFLFIHPIIYYFIGEGTFFNVFSTVLASYAYLIVIEEILIISMLKRPERNIKSIFGVRAANRAATT